MTHCREYLGLDGWCPESRTDGEFCDKHAAERREFLAGMR